MRRVSFAFRVLLACVPSATVGAAQDGVSPTSAIAALIDAAPEGATIVVPAGRYEGHLRVGKAVTLDGLGLVTIDGGGEGTVVGLLSGGITFRGFVVRGSGSGVDGEPAGIRAEAGPVVIEGNRVEDALFGIDLRTSPDSVVRGNRVIGMDLEPGRRGDGVRLWWSHHCVVEDNEVSNVRDMVFWYSEGLLVRRNRVDTSRYGLHFMYSHDTLLEENLLRLNSVGVYLMYSNDIELRDNTLMRNRGASGYGLGLKDCDSIRVLGNCMLANRVGIYVDNSPSSFDSVGLISGNIIAYNEVGALATPITHGNVVTGNGFIENEEQVGVHGRGDLSLNTFTKDGVGNFWSDYAGFDTDGDGIGELPYKAVSLFESLLSREPNLRLFVHSPTQRAVEFTARALPEIRPEPKFVDTSPLMAPPSVESFVARGGRDGGVMWLCAIGLVAGAAALAWAGARVPGLPVDPGAIRAGGMT